MIGVLLFYTVYISDSAPGSLFINRRDIGLNGINSKVKKHVWFLGFFFFDLKNMENLKNTKFT